jgi:hypothetical protein
LHICSEEQIVIWNFSENFSTGSPNRKELFAIAWEELFPLIKNVKQREGRCGLGTDRLTLYQSIRLFEIRSGMLIDEFDALG